MVTSPWVHRRSSPIALANLLEYLVRLPQVPAALGRIFEAGGPETLTYADMMRTLARMVGRRPPLIIRMRLSSPRLSARWLWLVTAVPISVARTLIGALQHDLAADDAELRKIMEGMGHDLPHGEAWAEIAKDILSPTRKKHAAEFIWQPDDLMSSQSACHADQNRLRPLERQLSPAVTNRCS